MWSPRSAAKHAASPTPPSPVLAAQLATELAGLAQPGRCPRGVYVVPTQESITRWQGVLFVHRGPYAGSVLRFALEFPAAYPRLGPMVSFESEVYHPLIEAKTRVYRPTGRMAQWQPGIHSVAHVLHDLKRAFKPDTLDKLTEHESANTKVWSLYNHSQQTFLSMTHQRALSSNTTSALYPNAEADTDTASLPQPSTAHVNSNVPVSFPGTHDRSASPASTAPKPPRTPSHRRQLSTASSTYSPSGSNIGVGVETSEPGSIRFRPLVKGEEEALRGQAGLPAAST